MPDVCQGCSFETDRLRVDEWRSLAERASLDRVTLVTELLTEEVTASLPEPWRGAYSADRARDWIDERDAEGTTLLVLETASHRGIGLVILFESGSADAVEVRLGYLLARSAWGQGFGTELLRGLVGWCRGQSGIGSLCGGVERENVASRRVLEKAGFTLEDSADGGDEVFYRLEL